jgi:hypothetical protein
MDVQTMLRTAVILLAVTALGGLLMAGMRFSGRPHPPTLITMVHGLLAASGLTLVLYVAFTAGLPGSGWIGLVLLLAAVLGGLVLNLRYHWERLELAAAAAIGLVVLALAVWNKAG